jgi:Malectin domain/Chitobiase/beta-hexosaminidase C-terminal domain
MCGYKSSGYNRATSMPSETKPGMHDSQRPSFAQKRAAQLTLCAAGLIPTLLGIPPQARAQTSVLTQHYDNARTGANTSETILTPANVNTNSFGKLFSQLVDGYVFAQPLYVPGLTMGTGTAQAGTTHNVIFVATENDSVYAFDADTNSGANASPLWQITLLDAAHGAAAGATPVPTAAVSNPALGQVIGITGTPVIDPTSGTLYVVGATEENATYVHRLHALDITTGAEKPSFNSPVTLAASVPGTGVGSVAGSLSFDDKWENQRAGLLLLNGIVYVAFGAQNENGPWHGWIFAYSAATLHQTGVYCTTPNAIGSGVWMGGSGPAADVVDPVNHPYGRMFVATGNGTYDATTPYTNSMDYGDDHLRLDLTNGVLTIQDSFTPFNQANLNLNDTDTGSGGVLILPDQIGGGHIHLLVQVGKDGRVFLVDRDSMGGYCSACTTIDTQIVQELPAAIPNGLWGMPAYWNGNIYFWGNEDNLKAYSFANGLLSSSPTSISTESINFEGSTPAVSSDGNTNGIVWDIDFSTAHFVLMAHNALNVADTLYSTTQNPSRDGGSNGIQFTVPTVANGKVYGGDQLQINVYGLLNGLQQIAEPIISPNGETFSSSLQVTITDSNPAAVIHYTTDGSVPTQNSTKYTTPLSISATTTVKAVAVATGYLQSSANGQAYTLLTQVAEPTFDPAPGTYSTTESVSIATTTPSASIYYTTDGSTPSLGVGTTKQYKSPISFSSTTVLNAIAVASGLSQSAVASGTYTIVLQGPAPTVTSATPNSGMQSQSNLSVVLKGTNFLPAPLCNFGAGIAVNSCTYNSATQITANISVAANATVGINIISVVDTDGQVATLSNGFSITANTNPFSPIFVNAGGPAYTGSQGQVWSADADFSGGSTYSTTESIANTADPTLYQTERYGDFSYQFGVPNGSYNVVLKFAEIYWDKVGQRIFNVSINGTPVLTNFDIIATAGAPLTAIDKTFSATTSTGAITIQFTSGSADLPKISAIEISSVPGVSVQVSPTTVGLYASQQQQFTSSVTGNSNTAVNWSYTPQSGTLTASGLYTAPASVPTAQTVSVTATSQADSTKSATATVNLLPPTPSFTTIFVHSGGGAYTDSLGNNWSADTDFTGGQTDSTTTPIANTPDPTLYQTERYGNSTYTFSTPPGNYTVILKFAEIFFDSAGERLFNVSINGTQVLTNFDIVAAAGAAFTAIDKSFPVTVTGSSITIQFTTGSANLPKISAIEVKSVSGVAIQVNPASASLLASQSQQFAATVTGTTKTAVTWSYSPQVGALVTSGTTAGLYTAPASITSAQTVTVTATSVADPTRASSAIVSLVPAFTPILVNSGGPAYTDSLAQPWSADKYFSGGSTYSTKYNIANTADPTLYQTERYGDFSYQFTVPNGSYNVVLKFAELYWDKAGQRLFNASINGTQILTSFDIIAAAGTPLTAIDKTFPVTVTNGQVTVQFTSGSADLPEVNAIEVH